MLYLHHANQLERLAQHFAALQQIDPIAPLATELVVVQNNGMGRWLSLQVAKFTGIAANIRYLFPAEMTWELLRQVLADVPEKDPCAPTTLRWRLFAIFLQEPEEWLELVHYLSMGEEGAWQLAGQVAKVFDQYLFFRPEWIRQWEQGEMADDWQARLWWRVAGERQLPHWVRLQARFTYALQAVDRAVLPQRITFFSAPVLSPSYVQLLEQVAQYTDVHIYLMNPSLEYWGDIESEKRQRKQAADVQALTTVGNPLLASWGRQGRDFIDQLIEANAETDTLSLFVESCEHSLLQRVQSDILHLRMPQEKPLPTSPYQGRDKREHLSYSPPDKGELEGVSLSLTFHACHSPMREAEVLYAQLLTLFAENPDLTPADVVVMTPEIDTYAPYLDAVFAAANPPLPYSIADSSPRFAQGILNLCQQLLALPQSRCDAESVLALLEFEEVRSHLGIDETQVVQCRAWIRAVNIRWGTDAPTRQGQGGANTLEHTWRYGLDRLLLGYALPGDALFAEVLPFNEIEGSLAEMLARLQQMLDAVFVLATWDGQTQQLQAWDQAFRHVLGALVGEEVNLQAVWQALDNLRRSLALAEFDLPIAWAVFKSAFAEQLDKRSESEGFLGRGITFCALMPMRTVPFRFVALLGMNDGVFPRRDVRASFDRMGWFVRRGDRLKRDEDRYLFLESVLSARDWLYISYVGQSQQDNTELPPSVLVSELLDYVERCGVAREALITKHRLQGWQGVSATTSGERLGWADASTLPEPDLRYCQLSLADLVGFYRNPARQFLRLRFGLRLGETDDSVPIREPFTLEDYRDADIRACIFQQLDKGNAAETALPLLRAQGLLPHGTQGDLLFQQEQGVTSQFFASVHPLPRLQHYTFSLSLDGFTLTGVLNDLDATGRKVYALGRLSYWQWLDIWLQHLLLNTLPDCPYAPQTQVFSVEKNVLLQPVADASAQLQQLLTWYWQGLHKPLPFFPKTAFEMAKLTEPTPARATEKWLSSYGYVGESEKPEYHLLYRGVNPLEMHWEQFLNITQQVFGQLFSAMK